MEFLLRFPSSIAKKFIIKAEICQVSGEWARGVQLFFAYLTFKATSPWFFFKKSTNAFLGFQNADRHFSMARFLFYEREFPIFSYLHTSNHQSIICNAELREAKSVSSNISIVYEPRLPPRYVTKKPRRCMVLATFSDGICGSARIIVICQHLFLSITYGEITNEVVSTWYIAHST